MAYKVKNIIVGAAAVYVSVKDSTNSAFWGSSDQTIVALPTLTAATPAGAALEASAEWRHLGLTTGGVEFAYEPSFGEVEVDQLMDAAAMFKDGQTASVNTTLAEATLKNLVLAWGQAEDTLGAATGPDATEGEELGISSGALYDQPVERSLVFVGPAPRSATNKKRERLYHVRRALNVESSSHSLAKDDPTNIPVSLRLLPDPFYAKKEYGIIRDRVVAA